MNYRIWYCQFCGATCVIESSIDTFRHSESVEPLCCASLSCGATIDLEEGATIDLEEPEDIKPEPKMDRMDCVIILMGN